MRHAYGNANIHADGDSDGNAYAITDGDGNSDGDAYAITDSNSYSNGNAYAITDSNSYSNGHCDHSAAGFTDATASADTTDAYSQLLLQF
jgi:hypothetical protein